MTYLRQIQRAVDFVEAHLDDTIDVADVSRAAGLSRWHFQRIFKALTGETIASYVRARRLSRSLVELLETRRRILDIAVDAGFETQASFTRTFKRTFGMTPAAFRKLGDKSRFARKLRLDDAHIEHVGRRVSREPELVVQPSMPVVGMTTRFFSVDSEKNNIASQIPPLWDRFLPHLSEIPHARGGVCCSVVGQTNDDSDQLTYCAGMEVTDEGDLPRNMQRIEIPAATYARFEHRGRVSAMDHTVSYIYSSWLLGSGRRHTGGPDLEIDGADSEDSVIHYAIPIDA